MGRLCPQNSHPRLCKQHSRILHYWRQLEYCYNMGLKEWPPQPPYSCGHERCLANCTCTAIHQELGASVNTPRMPERHASSAGSFTLPTASVTESPATLYPRSDQISQNLQRHYILEAIKYRRLRYNFLGYSVAVTQ